MRGVRWRLIWHADRLTGIDCECMRRHEGIHKVLGVVLMGWPYHRRYIAFLLDFLWFYSVKCEVSPLCHCLN